MLLAVETATTSTWTAGKAADDDAAAYAAACRTTSSVQYLLRGARPMRGRSPDANLVVMQCVHVDQERESARVHCVGHLCVCPGFMSAKATCTKAGRREEECAPCLLLPTAPAFQLRQHAVQAVGCSPTQRTCHLHNIPKIELLIDQTNLTCRFISF